MSDLKFKPADYYSTLKPEDREAAVQLALEVVKRELAAERPGALASFGDLVREIRVGCDVSLLGARDIVRDAISMSVREDAQ